MAPGWLTAIAWLYLSVCFCCAGIIAYDIVINHRRQPMGVMNFVFPITALYFGPFGLAFYWRWGRVRRQKTMRQMTMSPAAVSQTSLSQAAVASAGAGGQVPGGGPAHHGMAGVVGRDGDDQAAFANERSRPWWVMIATEVSHIADRVRDRAVRLDGDHDVRAVPGAARADAQLGRVLAVHAGWHDHRVLHPPGPPTSG